LPRIARAFRCADHTAGIINSRSEDDDIASRQIFKIIQVFVPTRRALVFLQVFEIDDIDGNAVDFRDRPTGVAFVEFEARDIRQNVDLQWRIPNAQHLVFPQKDLWRNVDGIESIFDERL
jgi:hypothetical protein